LTGGEPLLQPLKGLIRVLKRSGFLIQIETNGTLKPSVRADWWTVSPKPPEYLLQPEFKFRARELKLVVTRDLKIKTIEHLRSFLPARTPIILQPQSGRRWSQEKALALIKQCSQHNMENIRLMIQLHRWLKIP
jgi:organic radical activating enzyme